MTDLSLSAAFGNYDRVYPLQTGAVRVNGIALRIQTTPQPLTQKFTV